MFANTKDRRLSRHGSNIIESEERDQIGSGLLRKSKTIFDTAIVVDFVSNPVEFLSQKIEVIKVDKRRIGNAKEKVGSIVDKAKENLKKINKFSSTSLIQSTANQLGMNTEEVDYLLNFGQTQNLSRLDAFTQQDSSALVVNPELVSIMPRNSILAINISNEDRLDKTKAEVFFPFFPQHLSLPVKAGEHVWCFYENINGKKIGYWVSRKSATLPVDDLNYTHLDRNVLINTAVGILKSKTSSRNKETALTELFKTFPNASNSINKKSKTLNELEYDDILNNSKSYREEFVGQAVPRYNKKCSDLVLQGSNNTLITMTHDGLPNSGKISIIAGRSLNNIPVVKNKRDKFKNYEHEEIDKSKDILVTENISVINLGQFENNMNAASIEVSETGRIEIKNKSGAAIILDQNGDVIIQPSVTGLLKLGGEDADQAILGTRGTESVPGNVLAPAIISTMGGALGVPGSLPTGAFATKILVK